MYLGIILALIFIAITLSHLQIPTKVDNLIVDEVKKVEI